VTSLAVAEHSYRLPAFRVCNDAWPDASAPQSEIK